VGCAAFTYDVGALNAVEALGGVYVDSVPIVIINGTRSKNLLKPAHQV
jgi:indolepyruvate decarboxylase